MHERKVHLDGRELTIREGRLELDVLFDPTNSGIQLIVDSISMRTHVRYDGQYEDGSTLLCDARTRPLQRSRGGDGSQ